MLNVNVVGKKLLKWCLVCMYEIKDYQNHAVYVCSR